MSTTPKEKQAAQFVWACNPSPSPDEEDTVEVEVTPSSVPTTPRSSACANGNIRMRSIVEQAMQQQKLKRTSMAWKRSALKKQSVVVLQSWKELSSTHVQITGLERVLNSKLPLPKRILWFSIIMAAFGFLIYHLHNRLDYFNSNPVMVEISVEHSNEQPFPSVTICNANPLRLLPPKAIPPNSSLELDQKIVRSIIHRKAPVDFNSSTYDWDGFVYRCAHQMRTMLQRCEFQRQRCTYKSFVPQHTDFTLCYTFNFDVGADDKPLFSKTTGISNGLILELDAERHYYWPEPFKPDPGFRVVIHGQHEIPVVNTHSFTVGTGASTYVAIRRTLSVNLPPPHGRCGSRSLRYYKKYTPSRCFIECITNYTMERCRCRLPYMPGDAQVCDPIGGLRPGGMDWCRRRTMIYYGEQYEKCGCPVNCEEVLFDKSISMTSFVFPSPQKDETTKRPSANTSTRTRKIRSSSDNIPIDDSSNDEANLHAEKEISFRISYGADPFEVFDNVQGTDGDTSRAKRAAKNKKRKRRKIDKFGITRIHVYYESLQYTVMESKPAYTWLGLLCDTGGAMGLMLGCCFFTLIQLVDVLLTPILDRFFVTRRHAIQEHNGPKVY